MIKKNLALTVLANVDLVTKVTMTLSPVDIARLMLISCKELGKVPVLAPILMYQLELRLPYHPQELLLYDSLVKNDRLLRPLKETEITECDDLLEKATNKHLKRLLGDEHLSSDEQKELIRLYHLSSSPFSKPDQSELANNIQSYINTNLPEEKETLFDKLREEPGSNEEAKANHTRAITQRITDHPILVFATHKYGFTPLHRAAEYGEKEIALLLLEAGADVDATDGDGITPLHVAVESGKLETVEALLEAGAEVNATVTAGLYKGYTPLHCAAKEGKLETVKALLKAGAEVDATVPYGPFRGYTPLHFAANTEIAEYLLANGADVNAKDKYGTTPLHWAAEYGRTEVARLLIANGAEMDVTITHGPLEGSTPLQLATNGAIKALLHEAGATK